MGKVMTRAEMKRAADALHSMLTEAMDWDVAAEEHYAEPEDVSPNNPRANWGYLFDVVGYDYEDAYEDAQISIEASILLSEAHRPAGHDGDGTDEL